MPITIDDTTRCAGCMAETAEASRCPHCGYEPGGDRNLHALEEGTEACGLPDQGLMIESILLADPSSMIMLLVAPVREYPIKSKLSHKEERIKREKLKKYLLSYHQPHVSYL